MKMGCGASTASIKYKHEKLLGWKNDPPAHPSRTYQSVESECADEVKESISDCPTTCTVNTPAIGSLGCRRGRKTPLSLGSADSLTSVEVTAQTPMTAELMSCQSRGMSSSSQTTPSTGKSGLSLQTPGSSVFPPTPAVYAHPPSVTSHLTTGTQDQYAEPQQTIIFFDWDDTLFPTTWLDSEGLLRRKEAPTDSDVLAELEQLEKAAISVLQVASQLSMRTCIVTNASSPWVMDSAGMFMPQLHKLLESPNNPGPTVVHAREKLTQQKHKSRSSVTEHFAEWRNDKCCDEEARALLTQAKTVAMHAEVKLFYSQYPQQSWKNLISVGDASYERDALQEVSFVHTQPLQKKLRTKVIKLKTEPTSKEVCNQLQTIKMFLQSIVQFNDDLDVDFDEPRYEEALAKALQIPQTPLISTLSSKLLESSPEPRICVAKTSPVAAAGA